MLELKRGMTVRLIDRTAIDLIAKKLQSYNPQIDNFICVPKVDVGELGVVIKSENERGLAECTIIIDRSMVELA